MKPEALDRIAERLGDLEPDSPSFNDALRLLAQQMALCMARHIREDQARQREDDLAARRTERRRLCERIDEVLHESRNEQEAEAAGIALAQS